MSDTNDLNARLTGWNESIPDARTTAVMKGNKAKNTKPELAVRRVLHRDGFRYRIHMRPIQALNRTADIVFPRQRIAVFIDGCYWHGCPQHYKASKSNIGFWTSKISLNIERDADTDRILRTEGWKVLRYWSHAEPSYIAADIERTVKQERSP